MPDINPLQLFDPSQTTDNPLQQGAPSLGQAVNTAVISPALRWLANERANSIKMGFVDPNTGLPTTAGLVDAAKKYASGMLMGSAAPGEAPAAAGITAYHGSPHNFDRFDSSKIGTGEGAQAYGHGLYFAGNEGVAQGYRDRLSAGQEFYHDGDKLSGTDEIAAGLIHGAGGNKDAALKQASFLYGNIDSNPYLPGLRDSVAKLDPSKITAQSPPGSMYQVNIGADPEHFLDWDKPLSEQSQHVQEALKPLGYQSLKDAFSIRPVENGHVIDYVDNSGQARTTSRVFPTQDAAEQAARVSFDTFGRNPTGAEIVLHNPGIETQLHEAGIPGIRYLDAGSRNAGDGSRNTVVFDPTMIDILRKYGIAGLIAGGGAAATQGKQKDQ